MASAVIFGLALATVLTLVVVPTLYSLVYTTSRAGERGVKRIRRTYWKPFYHLTGTTPEEEEQERISGNHSYPTAPISTWL